MNTTNSSAVIDVWCFPIDVGEQPCRILSTVLSGEEQERAAAFRFDRDRTRFVAAHAALRLIVGERLGMSPGQVSFARNPHGKPRLANSLVKLGFSLSHSAGWCAVALALDAEVGIDLEEIRDVPIEDLASTMLTREETEWLRTFPAEAARRNFFRLWVCKEAVLKARGTGLQTDPRTLCVYRDGSSVLFQADGVRPQADGWHLREVELPAPLVCALACSGSIQAINVRSYALGAHLAALAP